MRKFLKLRSKGIYESNEGLSDWGSIKEREESLHKESCFLLSLNLKLESKPLKWDKSESIF